MSAEPTPSPRPWHLRKSPNVNMAILDLSGRSIAILCSPDETATDDALLIVRAVNERDELLAALCEISAPARKPTFGEADEITEETARMAVEDVIWRVEVARAALAKATAP